MKIPRSIYNWLSITGFIIAVNTALLIIVFFIFSFLSSNANIYNGVFTYIILPVILIIGLIMIPAGMIIKRRRMKDSDQRWPVLDLNKPTKRYARAVALLANGTAQLVSATANLYHGRTHTETQSFGGGFVTGI